MRRLFAVLFIICTVGVYAQNKITIQDVRDEYEAFEYKKVIALSDKILHSGDSLNTETLTEIYLMKAVSHYSLTEENEAKKCFFEILKIDRNYSLDPEKESPKIVSLFKETKDDYLQLVPQLSKKEEIKIVSPPKEEVVKTPVKPAPNFNSWYKEAAWKSMLLPGWGQYSLGEKTKGVIMACMALLSAGSMVYFIAKTSSRQDDYLKETVPVLINSKYNDYNNAYKLRNTLIVTTALIWCYSQADLFLWEPDEKVKLGLNIKQNEALPNSNIWGFTVKFSF